MIVRAEEILIDNGYENITIFKNPSYNNALIGVSNDNRAIYDYDKMIECLIKEEGFSEIDAMEWIEYNTIRCLSYVGTNSPIVMYPLIK